MNGLDRFFHDRESDPPEKRGGEEEGYGDQSFWQGEFCIEERGFQMLSSLRGERSIGFPIARDFRVKKQQQQPAQ